MNIPAVGFVLIYIAGVIGVATLVWDALPEDLAGRYVLFLVSVFWPLTVAVAAYEGYLKDKRRRTIRNLEETYQRKEP